VARKHLRGADFALYDASQALTAHSTGPKILTASKSTLAEMTGYSERTIGFARARLAETGWLRATSETWRDDQRATGKAGQFRTPEFEVIDHDAWAATHPGQCPTVYTSTVHGPTVDGIGEHGLTECGATTSTVHGPTTDTVHGKRVHKVLREKLKKKPKGDAGASSPDDFKNPKIRERFSAIRKLFIEEFERRNPQMIARFDGRDGKELRVFLEQQPNLGAETLVRWLQNAFASDSGFPLLTNFRLFQFCRHAETYANGPLMKKSGARRPLGSDEGGAKFEGVAQ
jgi:hypothetical protein